MIRTGDPRPLLDDGDRGMAGAEASRPRHRVLSAVASKMSQPPQHAPKRPNRVSGLLVTPHEGGDEDSASGTRRIERQIKRHAVKREPRRADPARLNVGAGGWPLFDSHSMWTCGQSRAWRSGREIPQPPHVPSARSIAARMSDIVSKPARSPQRCSSLSQFRTFFSAAITVEWLRPPK